MTAIVDNEIGRCRETEPSTKTLLPVADPAVHRNLRNTSLFHISEYIPGKTPYHSQSQMVFTNVIKYTKSALVTHHEGTWGSDGAAPIILSPATRRGYVIITFRLRPLPHSLNRRFGEPLRHSGRFGEKMTLLPQPVVEACDSSDVQTIA